MTAGRRYLVTGAGGMVGSALCEALRGNGVDLIAVGHSELDVANREDVVDLLGMVRPDVVINCAAYTNVDGCEDNRELAMSVNADAVRTLAEETSRWNGLLVQLSTDFVFDGRSGAPYEFTDTPSPLSVYGESKLKGERAAAEADRHLILRTSWVFGRGGRNFVEAIIGQLESGKDELRVVDDQRGRPTWVPHLVEATTALIEATLGDPSISGTFHYADAPACSWYEFAEAIVSELEARGELEREIDLLPVSSQAFPRPARRPKSSVLSTARWEEITGRAPESWRVGLANYLEQRKTP
ncbi:MAG: dTDP-4-dehydrorhamnose reductase [Acidobacteria bacterium]|nr:dTDP-4-dehydrorhamnose reductase [Acidobacteriota bacterium]